MNAERLLAHYEKIADAPDAITRLRRFILELAVRGKLVPQDQKDEPAAVFLKRIEIEKARLVKAGEIKRDKPPTTISDREIGFDLPAGWVATFLADVAVCLDYRRVPINSTEREARIAGKTQENLFPYFGATQQQGWIDEYLFDGEFVLLGEDGVPFSEALRTKAYLIKGKSWVNNHAHVFQGILTLPRFLVHYLNVFDYAGRVVGATRAKLNQAQALTIPIPLPPLAEQHRIVAKVDELMGLCDRLEAGRAAREAARDRLAAATLARLNAPDPATFQDDARFALASLPALTTRPDQIRQLRQTILNLAAQGKLVEQDPNDDPASELFKQIVTERNCQVSERRIRGATPVPSPSADVGSFPLPDNWAICALGQISIITDPNPSHRYPDYSRGTVPILSTREFSGENGWNAETAKLTTESFFQFQQEICAFSAGDIVFARKGRLGLPRFLPDLARFTFSHTVFVIKPMSGVYPEYLLWLLRRDKTIEWLTNEMNQNTGVPTLGKAKTERLPVPLPPFAEQHRIVAKVDALMALCDRLEASLTAAVATRRRLLDALLAEALAPAEDRELQAAE
jgi:type I restriction enzyme S subunit